MDGGLISEYRILAGNPPNAQHFQTSLKVHCRQFGQAPREVSGERDLSSLENELAARRRREKQGWFRAVQRFRNRIEGRISHLRRMWGLTRCLNHGLPDFGRWIGWGIIANNIAVMVMNLNQRRVALSDVLS